MKTIKLIAFGIFFLISGIAQAQVSVNINIGTPPSWGPAGYNDVEYYYLPDVQAYYDIQASQFIYYGSGKWIRSRYLPRQYRNYDLYNGYKVVLNDYHGKTPYTYYDQHKIKYYKGYKGQPQRTIGNRSDNHDYHKNKKSKRGHGKSKH